MVDKLIVAVIVALAIGAVARWVYRILTARSIRCSCGCSISTDDSFDCGQGGSCDEIRARLPDPPS
jgi:hypothetical protein